MSTLIKQRIKALKEAGLREHGPFYYDQKTSVADCGNRSCPGPGNRCWCGAREHNVAVEAAAEAALAEVDKLPRLVAALRAEQHAVNEYHFAHPCTAQHGYACQNAKDEVEAALIAAEKENP